MIAKLLPQKTLKNLALTEKLWQYPAQEALYGYLDLTDKNVLEKWVDVGRDKFFKHVHALCCSTRPFTESGKRDVDRFLNSHLEHFSKLSYLALYGGPVPSTLSRSFAENTLKVLKLYGCSISLYELVTLLNTFGNLEHLLLHYSTTKQSLANPPELLHHPKKLSLTGIQSNIHRELSELSLNYEQLAFDLYQDLITVQDFINRSEGTLKYLELGCSNVIGMYLYMVCPEITDWNPWFCFRFRSINIP